MIRLIAILISVFWSSFQLSAQLVGIYSAGDIADDFPNIQDAVTAIQSQGMIGTVEIVISSGEYFLLDVSSINAPLGEKLIFRSESGNAGDVEFVKGVIYNCDNIEFHDLSFVMPDPIIQASLVRIEFSNNARLLRCRIVDSYNTTSVWNDYAPLYFEFGNGFGFKNVYIDSCFIYSREGSSPYSPSRQTILVKGSQGKTFFYADTITGSYEFNSNMHREFKKCELIVPREIYGEGTDFIDSCNIFFNQLEGGGAGSYKLKADEISNSMISCNGIGNINFITLFMSNNYIYGNSTCSGGNGSRHINNYFDGELDFHIASSNSSQYNALFESNTVGGFATFWGINTPSYIVDNSFLGHVKSLGSGADFRFYHNNFLPGTYYLCQSWGDMRNNNFGDVRFETGLSNTPALTFSNNNYNWQDSATVHYTYFDDSPSYFDPEYISTMDLHINNPSLFSGSEFLGIEFLDKDMDGDVRGQFRSIGADETCLTIPLPDSIIVMCGNLYTLKYCDSQNVGNSWGPTNLLIDPQVDNPQLFVDSLVTVYLYDSLGTILDSTLLIPEMYTSRNRNIYGVCGIPYIISTFNQEGGGIDWYPGYLFSDSTTHVTSITLDTTTQIVAYQDLGQCGVRYDSIVFNIDRFPQAFIYADSSVCLGRRFQTATYCFDSIRWEFSDGTIYHNTVMLWHEFSEANYYDITVRVWLDGLMDDYTLSGYVGCVEIDEHEKNNFSLFPNPAFDYCVLSAPLRLLGKEYLLLNLNGELLLEGIVLEEKTQFDVSSLSNGTYFVKVGELTKKLIINSVN